MKIFRKTLPKQTLLLLIVLLVIGVVLTIFLAEKTSSLEQLDDATLETKAIAIARNYGLIGEPIEKKAIRMSLGEWNKLNDSELGNDASKIGLIPDMPVFVLVILGNIEWKGPSGTDWWGCEPEYFDNITIVLNAYTGKSMSVGSKRSGFPLAVPIP